METINKAVKKHGAINGLLYGIIILVLTILSFYFITSVAKSMIMLVLGPVVFSFVIPVALAVFFSFDLRKKIGGFWDFRQATTGLFIMFFVTYAVSTIGNMAFSKFIEPDMVEKMKTVFVTTTTQALEKQGVDQDTIDKKVTDIEANFDGQKDVSIGKVAKGVGIAIIMDFVIALIFAAFFKKEPLLLADNVSDNEPIPDVDPTA
jgi:hypothetical protein